MRIYDVEQRSEAWEQLRLGRPTASNFDRIVTPVKGDYAAGARTYAYELICQRRTSWTPPPPSFWMEWGTEHESDAVIAYEAKTGRQTQSVGFVLPDDTDAYGGSPDRFVLEDGQVTRLLECKCPAPTTLIEYLDLGKLPSTYRPQVQGLLWITGLPRCDFFAWHPEIEPFLLTIERDQEYIEKIAEAMTLFLVDLERIASKVRSYDHTAFLFGEVSDG
jgi:predicted phage-related endonuclease